MIREKIANAFHGLAKILGTTNSAEKADPLVSHYNALEAAYLNSNLYDRLALLAQEGTEERKDLTALRSLRNPAHRVVEFYAAKLRLDVDTIEYGVDAVARQDNLKAAIKVINRASNWGADERVAARQFSWAGDLFLKVSNKDKNGESVSVYLERMDPRHVTDFDKDERGYFTLLRIDTPKSRRLDDGEPEDYTLTEVWSKEDQLYSVYEHQEPTGSSLDKLGTPEDTVLSGEFVPDEEGGYTGYDFIPVVHAKARDIGADRGLSVFAHAFGGIRESDRIATKLHDMLFPRILWVLTSEDGAPGILPEIKIEEEATGGSGKQWANGHRRYNAEQEARSGIASRLGEDVARLSSGVKLEPKIPDRNFQAHSNALAEQVKEVERELPEASLDRLREMELSGRAMRTALGDVYDRYTEAFENFSSAMVRAYQMAFTVGQVLEIEGFSEQEIGIYGPEFDFEFVAPDPFPTSVQDDLDTQKVRAEVHAAMREIGGAVYRGYLLDEGYDEKDADAIVSEAGTATRSPIDEILAGGNLR